MCKTVGIEFYRKDHGKTGWRQPVPYSRKVERSVSQESRLHAFLDCERLINCPPLSQLEISVLVMKDLLEWSYNEIADVLKMNPSTLRTLRMNAIRKLRRNL